jgi:hypothetical protein
VSSTVAKQASRENHGCDGLNASRKQLAYDLEDLREGVQDRKKIAYAGGRKVSEQSTHKCEVNSGEGNGKPLPYS